MASDRLSPAERAVSATVADMAAVQSVYQPILDLTTGAVVGVEALSRWPEIGPVPPEDVFAAARAAGVAAEIEWACRIAAARGALAAELGTDTVLFMNLEPYLGGDDWPPPESALAFLENASENLRIVLEITERGLLTDPAELLSVVEWARQRGAGIAVDDVGANPQTMALLPFIDPDIVKLDRTLIQDRLSADTARVLEFALEHVEQSGALVIAEGIETERHLEQAVSLGAQFGQGYLLGKPAALGEPAVSDEAARRRLWPGRDDRSTPITFRPNPSIPARPSDLFSRARPRTARAELLGALSLVIEEQALTASEPLSVLAAFQDPGRYTDAVAARYEHLARLHPFVAVLGAATGPGSPTVHTAGLDPDDLFADEWTVVVVGPHTAVALVAKDLHDDEPGRGRRFEFLLTHDRELVVAAGRSLIRRILPS